MTKPLTVVKVNVSSGEVWLRVRVVCAVCATLDRCFPGVALTVHESRNGVGINVPILRRDPSRLKKLHKRRGHVIEFSYTTYGSQHPFLIL